MKKRGGKDNRPLGVTKSILAMKQELQNYGVKDKHSSIFNSDFKRRPFNSDNLPAVNNQLDTGADSLYPPMKVPGLNPGEMPRLKIDDMHQNQRIEIENIANYEQQFMQRMQNAPTYLLFNKQKGASGVKEELRKKLRGQYIESLMKGQPYLFPPQLPSIGKVPQTKPVNGQSKKDLQMLKSKKHHMMLSKKREHQKSILQKRLLQETKISLEDHQKWEIHQRGEDDEDHNDFMPGELPQKRLKLKQESMSIRSEAAEMINTESRQLKNEELKNLDEQEINEEERQNQVKREDEDDEEEENNQQEFEDEYYVEEYESYAGNDDDDDDNGGVSD